MNIEELREYCLSAEGSSESCPFLSDTVLVFKVAGKMFAYVDLEPKTGVFTACLKCDPQKSAELRDQYHGIKATPFKTLLWNAVNLADDVPDNLIKELIDHSIDEVIKKLPKAKREEYKNRKNGKA